MTWVRFWPYNQSLHKLAVFIRKENCMGKLDTETFKNIELLKIKRIEHQDLDQVINALSENPASDQLLIRRLKKRKLLLKDQIIRLESDLIPDMDA